MFWRLESWKFIAKSASTAAGKPNSWPCVDMLCQYMPDIKVDMYQAIIYSGAMKRTSISEQLRRAITESGMSRYRVAQLSGIDHAAMSRFMAGTTGLTTNSVDKLCEALSLELVGPPLGTKKVRRSKA